ncbi:S41 family peptidase [Micromonospora krabiensis]|uniref:N-terminal domain of Peptidase_S41 n=1 Tax=Micromonospora krabiensis TaxID=307121 RepID=A0A1C3N599_9ACTN|nr:S41 family peptidase [Micromonospora krabiensis]SBV27743.1 N-terminal domain of Peptidase_S41 [Micromonospora krabiensis]
MRQAEITAVVERTANLVEEHYVFPEVASQLSVLLADQLAAGRYADTPDPRTLGDTVTADLQSLNGDRHLRLKHHDEPLADRDQDPDDERIIRLATTTMGGIAQVRRLDGNVGLLEIQPHLFPPQLAGDQLTAALRLLADTDALLLDLRENVGGSPDMVALICGWLFEEPTLLHTMYNRAGEPFRQSWSAAYLPVPRYAPDKPVHVLTSRRTFSGGEELAYDLQQSGRATVVGERTGGGAHPRIGFRAHAHLEVTVPIARPVHPISGTNWEGTGVRPDIETPAEDALAVAHRAVLSHRPESATAPRPR